MVVRTSLLQELKKGGYEASLITTFNAYLPFYEDVVLRRLQSAGVRHNVLMMDAGEYSRCLESFPPRLAGSRYTLLPISVSGAFHPKVIFLVGKKKGFFAIGSHNMTLSGFGFNRELTNTVRIDSPEDDEGVYLAKALWSCMMDWVAARDSAIPQHVVSMAEKVRHFAPWLDRDGIAPKDTHLLAAMPGQAPLWDQLKTLCEQPVEQASILGAFFDRRLEFLRRFRDDLSPSRCIVGIDPDTVQMPPVLNTSSGIQFVNAAALAQKSESEGAGYLHAKAVLLAGAEGRHVLVSGSANPSAPAWLQTTDHGNVEIMLAHTGAAALDAARAIGITELPSMEVIGDHQLSEFSIAVDDSNEGDSLTIRSGIAVFRKDLVWFDGSFLDGVSQPSFVLLSAADEEIETGRSLGATEDMVGVEFSSEAMRFATLFLIKDNEEVSARFVLHREDTIQKQSLPGAQRQLRDALTSLDTDAPNLELLVRCVTRITESGEMSERSASSPQQTSNTNDSSGVESGSPLETSIEDIDDSANNKRLQGSSDLIFLLNMLVYHLGAKGSEAPTGRGGSARSEEELIDSDDEEDDEQARMLSECHSAIRRLVRQCKSLTNSYVDQKITAEDFLLRLLAVIAVIREFRRCDDAVPWVPLGGTTVPAELRRDLLDSISPGLFSAETPLMWSSCLERSIAESDEYARLRGLLLWLVFDSGMSIERVAPFNETEKGRLERLRLNSVILFLADEVKAGDVSEIEARQTIEGICPQHVGALEMTLEFLGNCRSQENGKPCGEHTKPGCVIRHSAIEGFPLRVVLKAERKRLRLAPLSTADEPKAFTAVSFQTVWSPNA